jgi:cell division protein FtsZ
LAGEKRAVRKRYPNSSQTSQSADASTKTLVVKFFGVGDAGIAMVQQMTDAALTGAAFAAVNASSTSLSDDRIPEKILLEKKMLRGLGTGGDPERGRAAAEEHLQKLKDACAGVDVALVVAGLGGGAGTGISPVLARTAREAGALTLALVTLPFTCEGNRRTRQAAEGLEALKAAADGVIWQSRSRYRS